MGERDDPRSPLTISSPSRKRRRVIKSAHGDGICDYCRGITVEGIGKSGGGPHALSIETVRQNAESCRLCRWIQGMDWCEEYDED